MLRYILVLIVILFSSTFFSVLGQKQNEVFVSKSDSIQDKMVVDKVIDGIEKMNSKQFHEAIISFDKADSLAQNYNNPRLRASSIYNKGMCFYQMGVSFPFFRSIQN